MVETLVPIAKGLLQLVSVLSIGLIIAVAFLDKDIKGSIKSSELTKKIKKYYIFWSDCLFIRSINFIFIRYNCNPILFDSNLTR